MTPPEYTAHPADSTACKAQGDACLDAGKFPEAVQHYRQAIALNPDYAEAYSNLGIALWRQQQFQEAEQCLKQAVLIKPGLANAYYNLGSFLQEQGNLDEALAAFDKLIEIRPDIVDAYVTRGIVLQDLNRLDEALASCDKAIALKPDYGEAHNNRGVILRGLNRLDEALASYDRVIALNPGYVRAYFNRGVILQDLKRLDEALASFKQAIAFKPDYADAHNAQGSILFGLDRLDEALASCDKAIALKPDYAEAHHNRGVILQDLNRLDEALASCNQAIALYPDLTEAHQTRISLLHKLNRLDEALASCDRLIALMPDDVEALGNRASILRDLNRLDETIDCYRRILSIEPGHPGAQIQLIEIMQHQCQWDGNQSQATEVIQLASRNPEFAGYLAPLSFMALPGITAMDQKQCAEMYAHAKFSLPQIVKLGQQLNFKYDCPGNEIIRIGYLSADYQPHPVSFLMAEVFELHDRDRFHITAYSCGADDRSAIRSKLEKAFDQFTDIRSLSLKEAAQKIYQDRIDILVDLTGYTKNSRSDILALRPAPIQVNYLGYPGTMGANFIDYIIADQFTVPPDNRKYYTEQVAWMPDCFQANNRSRPRPLPPTRSACELPDDSFVFCCFNQNYKITPEVFDVWCRLLANVPHSVLWLPAPNPVAANNLQLEAERRGIDRGRLILAPYVQVEDNLARLQCADLFLDTLPFNAGTTCSDALWMGLPVVTCAGEAFASRMAGSLLTAIGVPELITYNLDDYYQLALELATDKDRLAAIRNKIRDNRDTSPLFDSERFTRNLEQLYMQMVTAYSAGTAAS